MDTLRDLAHLVESRRYEVAAEFYQKNDVPAERAAACDWHYMGALSCQYAGDYFGARDAVRLALDEQPTGDMALLVRFRLAYLEREIGDAAAAIKLFEELLESPHHSTMREMLTASIHQNLALAYYQNREYSLAVHHYHVAANHFRSEGLTQLLCHTLHNLAWTLADMNDCAGAQATLDEAYAVSSTQADREFQAVTQAYVHFRTGNKTDALKVAERLVTATVSHPAVQGYAALVAGEVSAALAHHTEALAMASIASERSVVLKDTRLMRMAQELRVRTVKGQQGA